MFYQINDEGESEALKTKTDSQLKKKQLRMQEKLPKRDFNYDTSEFLEPMKNIFAKTNKKLLQNVRLHQTHLMK